MKSIVVVVISVLIAACSSVQKSDSQTTSGASDKSVTGTSSTNSLTAAEIESRKLAAEVQGLQQQSVYFDLDKSDIKPEYRSVILKQAEFIKAHKHDVVTVQGNTDERGSSEYNLALGERRANAARKSLELLDVPAVQIKTASFGLEKPRLLCHEEKCWKENRRDDFVHQLD